jgi:hypothetical protein
LPISAFAAFFVFTFFFALGLAIPTFLAVILLLSLHHEDAEEGADLDSFFFAIKLSLILIEI